MYTQLSEGALTVANIGDVTTEQETDAHTTQGYVARAYAARHATSGLGRTMIRRRQPGPHDVQIDILFCGVCHSDLHQVRNEWSEAGNPTIYPCVPGHEIVGRVSKIGSSVSKFKAGTSQAGGAGRLSGGADRPART